jgi:hypothetical protein
MTTDVAMPGTLSQLALNPPETTLEIPFAGALRILDRSQPRYPDTILPSS